jgi:hypothetical protein
MVSRFVGALQLVFRSRITTAAAYIDRGTLFSFARQAGLVQPSAVGLCILAVQQLLDTVVSNPGSSSNSSSITWLEQT